MRVMDPSTIDPRWRKLDRGLRRKLQYGGTRRQCPCCGKRWRRLGPSGQFPDVRCPACGSFPRHRTLWLYLSRNLALGVRPLAILHYSPEASLRSRLQSTARIEYTSVDIDPNLADEQMNATALGFSDASFDLIICSHVLEHVDDDQQAMCEMHRVLRLGGVALLQHPIVPCQTTFEDPSVTNPAERLELFSQEDHVRVYGPDIEDRLHIAGFDVSIVTPEQIASPPEFAKYGLAEPLSPVVRASDIYQCTRRHTSPDV